MFICFYNTHKKRTSIAYAYAFNEVYKNATNVKVEFCMEKMYGLEIRYSALKNWIY